MTDTNKMRDESREQFEAFCRDVQGWEDDDFRLASDGVNYYWSTTGEAWIFWQASRQAVVVELPAEWSTNVGTMLPPPAVHKAIEAHGLRVGVRK